jgi:hypothetical protein
MQWASPLANIVGFFEDSNPFLGAAGEWIGLYADAGEAVLDTAAGPPGNPAALVDQYVLLESQLELEELDVETQVADVLNVQLNGVERSEEILLSGPAMMAAVNDAAGTTWNFGDQTADVYTAAQTAYLYNVRQLTYEDLWPQAYSATRFSYSGACEIDQDNKLICWYPSANTWKYEPLDEDAPADRAISMTAAAQPICQNSPGGHPYRAARPGSTDGHGDGTEYRAQVSAAEGGAIPQYLDYVMAETSTLTNATVDSGNYPKTASMDVVQPFFAQPDDDATDPNSERRPGTTRPTSGSTT